jgi:hypothetical protein
VELAVARAEMARARANMARGPPPPHALPTGAVIHNVEDDDIDEEEEDNMDFLPYDDEEADGMSAEQRALVA